MLAKDTEKPFDDKEWLYEIKWDGYRAIADVTKDEIALYSRRGNDFRYTYPLVVEALKKIKFPAILDGEIVVLNENGFPDFQKIQNYENNSNFPLQYMVFDLLSLNGHSLLDVALIERKELLRKLIDKKNPVVKFSGHIIEKGNDFFELAMKKNLEGIMAKKMNSHYYPGKRSNEWLKIKTHKTADVIIAGYTAPTGSRSYFGSLVFGIKDGRLLKYVGNAGSGYNEDLLKKMYTLLQPLIQTESPFKSRISFKTAVTWVKPVMICEVKFSEWTNDEKLRHPVFLQLRNDKSIKEIEMKNAKPVKVPAQKLKGESKKKRKQMTILRLAELL